MTSATAPRPPALTLACVFVGVGSLVLLLNLATLLTAWVPLEVQEAVRTGLAEEPLRSTGVTLTQALSWLEVLLYVGVVLSVCGLVLAFFTARGDRGARIGLTVLCVLGALMLVLGGVVGALPAAFLTACVFSLWSTDSRRWFAARNAEVAPGAPASAVTGPDAFAAHAPSAAAADTAAAVQVQESAARADAARADAARPDAARPDAGHGGRPRAVDVAAFTALVTSAVVAFFGVVGLLAVTLGADSYRTALEQPGAMQDIVRGAGWQSEELLELMRAATAGWVALSVLGLVSAVLALRRLRAGEVALRIVSIVTIGVSVLFLPLGILTGAAAVVTLVQLRRPEARQWFTEAR